MDVIVPECKIWGIERFLEFIVVAIGHILGGVFTLFSCYEVLLFNAT